MNYLSRVASIAWLYLRRPLLVRRARRLVIERVDGVPFVVLPEVLNPVIFRGGELLARTVATAPEAATAASGVAAGERSDGDPTALDMGTGCGVGAVFAARRGYRVSAVDLSPQAVRCASINVLLNGLEERIAVHRGDLFAPVAGRRFDLVLFNPPFYRGEPEDSFDMAWRGTDVLERFAGGLAGALTPGGRALLLLSDRGEAPALRSALAERGFLLDEVARRDYGNEVLTVERARATADGVVAKSAVPGAGAAAEDGA